jgi:uncharacterized heparinase superfamily protein
MTIETIERKPRKKVALLDKLKSGLESLTFGNPLYDFTLSGPGDDSLRLVPPDPWPGEARLGSDLTQGIYRFAGASLQLESPVWQPEGVSEKFVTELNGFDWLRDLRALGGDVARRQARTLVRNWIDRNGSWQPVTWEPALLARRITNWIALYDFFCATADDDFKALVMDSLRRQTRHLARAFPTIQKGAGRFAALKGLFYTGICMSKGEAKLAYALRHLPAELAVQILPDGGHVSRSPATLLGALRDLIDIRTVLSAGAQEIPEKLQHAIDRMTPAVRFFRHADGALALFHGGREESTAFIDSILAHADAKGRPLKSMSHSGFERITAGRTCIIMDAGAPPPASYDSEAHAGLLAFELSVGRDRIFVNCGAHPSRLSGWRKALGASAAHNTMIVNDTNAIELTDSGLGRRVARLTAERQEENGAAWVEATHDGYDALFRTTHFRRLYVADGGEDVRGEDTLEGPASFAFALRFHLHPGVQASLIQGGAAVLLATPSGGGWRFRATGGHISLEESIYCGKGDEPRRTTQIVVENTTAPDSTTIKWALQREKKGS